MRTIKQIMRSTLFVGGSVLIALGFPLTVFADTAPTTTTDTTTTTPSDTTKTNPPVVSTTSPSSSTDTAPTTPPPTSTNTSPSPPTVTTSPITTPPKTTYTYDSATGRWNSSVWTYDPVSGTYKETVVPIAPPASTTSTPPPSAQTTVGAATTTAIANALNASATSGDASVLKNTTAGNATSGDASSVATIVNNVNSSLTNSSNKQAANFVSNVMGDVNGDILLQPMLLKAMLEAKAQPAGATLSSNTTTGITNNLTLGASSGNAAVSDNTSAGNASSGTANTVANVVNIVNSMVAANQSFVGTINIYGNLNGDILLAPDFIPQLLASNAGAPIPAPVGTASVTSNDTQSIVNNIALAAQTGQAVVANNTSAGNATTGTASTNAVIFNLTGHNIVASNSLLVFVNVLGKWVGVIVDAPTGATAAALGSGVTSNSVAPNLVIDATNSTQLTNNINLSSKSGNASVSGNTKAGNATTGNATASANVANISGSEVSTSGWFGVLFINVFGSWFGSFGINTAAGDAAAIQPQDSGLGGGTNTPPRVMEFIPHNSARPGATVVQGVDVTTTPPTGLTTAALLTGTTGSHRHNASAQSVSEAPIQALNLPLLIGSIIVIGGSLFGLRKPS